MCYISKSIALITPDGSSAYGELKAWEEDPENTANVLIQLSYDGQMFAASSDSFFAALCCIRKELEALGLRIVCYGSSRNVYPSGMSRTMGCGEMAYKLYMGKKGARVDIVSIFATGPDVEPATIAEQRSIMNNGYRV